MQGLRIHHAMAAVLSAAALLGCTSATLRYVAPAHDEALDARSVRLTWKVTPAETPLKSCVVEIGADAELSNPRKTLLTNGMESPHSMFELSDGQFGYDMAFDPGTYFWRVTCDATNGRRLITRDVASSDEDRSTARVRRFAVGGDSGLVNVTPRPAPRPPASVVVTRQPAEARPVVFEWPDVVRPAPGTPPPREGSVALAAARWDGSVSPIFATELETRLVEAGFYLQQGNDLVEKATKNEDEKGQRPFRLLADSLVFGFEGPPSSPLSRPDRLLIVDVRSIAFDAELFGPELARKAVQAELAGAAPYPRSLRAVYARFVDAKTGRVQWTDRFYVAPSVSMNRVVTELLRR